MILVIPGTQEKLNIEHSRQQRSANPKVPKLLYKSSLESKRIRGGRGQCTQHSINNINSWR